MNIRFPIRTSMLLATGCLGFASIGALPWNSAASPPPQSEKAPAGGNVRTASDSRDLLSSLTAYELQALELPAFPPESFQMNVTLGHQTFTMVLSAHSIRADNYQVLEHGASGVVPRVSGPDRTYSGLLLENPGARVRAYLRHNGAMSARIKFPDGSWYIQPAPGIPGVHVIYRGADVVPSGGQCGVESASPGGKHAERAGHDAEHEEGGGGSTRGGGQGTGGFYRAVIACDADYSLFQNEGGVQEVEDFITEVIHLAEADWEEDVGICYAIGTIIVRTSDGADPYSSNDASTLLCQFKTEWDFNLPSISRNVAHLWTNRELDGSTIGMAYVGGLACQQGIASGCNNGFSNRAYGLSEHLTSLAERIVLFSHEVGHNWNACHCNDSGCAQDSECIMWSFVGSDRTFQFESIQAILAHRNAQQACIEGCACGNLVTVLPPASMMSFWNAFPDCGTVFRLVPGFGNYRADLLTTTYPRLITAPSGPVLITRP